MDKNYIENEKKIVAYVKSKGSITNRECRKLLELSYDDSVRILGLLTKSEKLVREGSGSGTKYVLP